MLTLRIFTDGHRVRAILRVPLAVDTKTSGVTLIQILLLVLKAKYFSSCVLFPLQMTSSLKTNNQSWDQLTFKFNISADNLVKLFENVLIEW